MTSHFHFIGIGGIGMSALAKILLEKGCPVSGSDIAQTPITHRLSQLGAKIYVGHHESQIPQNAFVIYSSDIHPDNVEFIAAKNRDCILMHRADLLAHLTTGYKTLAVAGTHGKTTTSSLLTTVLYEAHLQPAFAIGGILPAFESNASHGQGSYFVIEADESDRSFLKYSPFGAICTNIDNDHLVNYNHDMQLLISHFQSFLNNVTSSKHLLWCKDDPLLDSLGCSGMSYGFHPDSSWHILNAHQNGFSMTFDLSFENHTYSDIFVSLAGKHNVLNSAAVFALATQLGIEENAIRSSFSSFKGVLRRCEKKGVINNIEFIDDYAHHPTEIETTLKGLKQAIGKKRLVTVFQPHRYSRVKDCHIQYGSVFDASDVLVLTDIYAAGESPIPGISAQSIKSEIEKQSNLLCHYVPRNELKHFMTDLLQENDVMISLGAGDITKLSAEIIPLLQNNPHESASSS